MAYKFQLGQAILSGSLTQEGQVLAKDSALSGSSLSIAGVAVTATADEINYLDEASHGVAAADKALIADGSANIDASAITFTDLGTVTSVDINGGTIDGATIATSNVTVGSGKTLDVSSGTLTTSAAQKLAILQGAGSNVDIGAFDLRAQTLTADGQTAGRVAIYGANGLLSEDADLSFSTDTLIATKLSSSQTVSASVVVAAGGFQLGSQAVITAAGNFQGNDANFAALTASFVDFSGVSELKLDSVPTVAYNKDDFMVLRDATTNRAQAITLANVSTAIGGNGLSVTNGVLAVNPDASGGLEIRSGFDSVQIKASGVTNAMLAGSIANAKLANDSVSFGGVSLDLGQSDATPAFDLSDAASYPGDSSLVTAGALNGGSITSGFGSIDNGSSAITTTGTGSFGKVVVSGDLIVRGSTTTIDSSLIQITGGLAFEGATADGFETTLGVVDPSAARTVNIANSDGTLVPFATPPAAGTQITATPAEINLLDAGAGSSVQLAPGDGLIIFDVNHTTANGARKVLMSDVATFVSDNISESVDPISGNETLLDFSDGKILMVDCSGGNVTVDLPTAANHAGEIIKIKKASATNNVIIATNGSETIDTFSSITLESPFAAVQLICHGGNWHVM